MNKGELIDKIAKDAKISKVQASNALNSVAGSPKEEGVSAPRYAPTGTPVAVNRSCNVVKALIQNY